MSIDYLDFIDTFLNDIVMNEDKKLEFVPGNKEPIGWEMICDQGTYLLYKV